ncbi:MAG: hypothetical protein JW702_05095 [Clostridiales bacterium]|nr:hypothetical protein [Clostridiales bacterium]
MKKVLIMTLATGGGHNYVAATLETVLKKENFDVEKIDPFKEGDPFLNIFISEGYNKMATKTPHLYGKIYKLSDKETTNDMVLKLIRRKSSKNMLSIIEKSNADIIISTHPIITFILGAFKENKKIELPVMSVVTDFIGHYTYTAYHNQIDAYITGSAFTKKDLIKRGVPENKIFAFGIPIIESFYQINESVKKDDVFTVLLMGGSLGLKQMVKVMEEIAGMKSFFRIIVVCGKDTSLKETLDNKYLGKEKDFNKEIEIYGFTDEVSNLMDQSDLMITKPGGLTVSEAIAKRLPVLIPFMIPGQEEENANLLEIEGAGIKLDDIKNIASTVSLLKERPYLLNSMRSNMEMMAKTHSLEAVVQKAIELSNGKYENEKSEDVDRKKILILYGGFSRGAIETAASFKDEFLSQGVTVETLDFLKWIAPHLQKTIKWLYWSFYRSDGNKDKIVESARKMTLNIFDDWGMRIYMPIFKRYMDRFNPDMMIALFSPWEILGEIYKKKYKPDLKIAACTFVLPKSSKVVDRNIDVYLVQNEAIEKRLIELNVEKDKIVSMKLPIGAKLEKGQSEKYLESLIENEGNPILVLLGDESDSLPESRSFFDWIDESGWATIVLTGENRQLNKLLNEEKYQNIVPIKSVEEISDLVGAADMIVSKYYYITALEALASKTPFLAYGSYDEIQNLNDPIATLKAADEEQLKILLKSWIKDPNFKKEVIKEVDIKFEWYKENYKKSQGIEKIVSQIYQ